MIGEEPGFRPKTSDSRGAEDRVLLDGAESTLQRWRVASWKALATSLALNPK